MFAQTLNAKVAELRAELAAQEEKLAEFNVLSEEQRLATILHEKECHDSYCGWSFATNKWDERDHVKFVKKATEILAITDYDTYLRLLEVR
jgi:hypothetical protein